VVLSLALAVVIGLVAGVLPARSAAQLEPLDALRAE
jgi:ABC-type antimicrobial peptide transport system permease subunit